MLFSCCGTTYDLAKKALILGILNVTPDSFSDGGSFLEVEKAAAHGLQLLAEGASILDIGGESTRPGALPITAEEELRRVIPVIRALRKKTEASISIDTSKATVAEAAIVAGATIINDISGLENDPSIATIAASTGAGLILMHKQGTPLTMQAAPSYPNDDVVASVINFLSHARAKAIKSGVAADAIVLDPGLGFGKTVEHNFTLLRAIPQLTQLGAPLLIGHSRKSFLGGAIDNRLFPSIAVTSLARYHGAMLFRVHDPLPHREALAVVEKGWKN